MIGVFENCWPKSFSKLISVVCNLNFYSCFGLCCLKVISELKLSCLARRGK